MLTLEFLKLKEIKFLFLRTLKFYIFHLNTNITELFKYLYEAFNFSVNLVKYKHDKKRAAITLARSDGYWFGLRLFLWTSRR